MAQTLSKGAWDGDRDSLDTPPEPEVWSPVAAEGASCTGKHCPAFSQCTYYDKRKELVGAQVIVANHDLLLSSLGARVLPELDNCLLVLDEAHHLPATALRPVCVQHGLVAHHLDRAPLQPGPAHWRAAGGGRDCRHPQALGPTAADAAGPGAHRDGRVWRAAQEPAQRLGPGAGAGAARRVARATHRSPGPAGRQRRGLSRRPARHQQSPARRDARQAGRGQAPVHAVRTNRHAGPAPGRAARHRATAAAGCARGCGARRQVVHAGGGWRLHRGQGARQPHPARHHAAQPPVECRARRGAHIGHAHKLRAL